MYKYDERMSYLFPTRLLWLLFFMLPPLLSAAAPPLRSSEENHADREEVQPGAGGSVPGWILVTVSVCRSVQFRFFFS